MPTANALKNMLWAGPDRLGADLCAQWIGSLVGCLPLAVECSSAVVSADSWPGLPLGAAVADRPAGVGTGVGLGGAGM